MDSCIFPQICETLVQQGKASYEKKCIFHERLLYHYLSKKIVGWSVKDFLEVEKIETYALYAVTDFTMLFIKDLNQNGGIDPIFIGDKNAEMYSHEVLGHKVQTLEEMVCMYKNGIIKTVIVMSVLHENEIIEELLKCGISLCDIISIVNVLYSKKQS